jgi:hypothetical protein
MIDVADWMPKAVLLTDSSLAGSVFDVQTSWRGSLILRFHGRKYRQYYGNSTKAAWVLPIESQQIMS